MLQYPQCLQQWVTPNPEFWHPLLISDGLHVVNGHTFRQTLLHIKWNLKASFKKLYFQTLIDAFFLSIHSNYLYSREIYFLFKNLSSPIDFISQNSVTTEFSKIIFNFNWTCMKSWLLKYSTIFRVYIYNTAEGYWQN